MQQLLVLTAESLAKLHDQAVAPIRRRWIPETHQPIDAERQLRQMLGESTSWAHLRALAERLNGSANVVKTGLPKTGTFAAVVDEAISHAAICVDSLSSVVASIEKGDMDLLEPTLTARPSSPNSKIASLPRQLRAAQSPVALIMTNVVTDCRITTRLLDDVRRSLVQTIAVLADAGCGKTQLAAQITAPSIGRPCGLFLHGRDLHAKDDLNKLANKVVINGLPVASMEALIAAVDAAGQRAHKRIPIVIDGLNEAEDPRIWRSELASVNQVLVPYAYVLLICTVRTSFAEEALPKEMARIEIPDFGDDGIDAIRRYFDYYKINAADAELPIGLLKHPLTLRFFCEVTNPSRKELVGIEAMPESLTALFERYLSQAAERIAELAPLSHRYYEQDVRFALDQIGTLLWERRARSIELRDLRDQLQDSGRPWNASIVNALEQEGILIRYPESPPYGPTVAGVYDALAGHLVANAILSKRGREGFEEWLKLPETLTALDGERVDQHPLAFDTFRALVGLVPRRLFRQQLWTLLNSHLRSSALRYAAELEAKYLDAATVDELRKIAAENPLGGRDIFNRLWQTRTAQAHPLNATFLDSILMPMKLSERDLRWSEWIRRHYDELKADIDRLDVRRRGSASNPDSERLRARWVLWTLSTTVRELRDRSTRALYWFGRRDPVGLLRLTLHALKINDPYISERALAASYGISMALHCRPKGQVFRTKSLPTFAKYIYLAMFAPAAQYSTTHHARHPSLSEGGMETPGQVP